MLCFSLCINEIILFYPETIKAYEQINNEIIIRDEFADGLYVNIKAFQLPIINREIFSQTMIEEIELTEIFDNTKTKLIERIKEILIPTIPNLH